MRATRRQVENLEELRSVGESSVQLEPHKRHPSISLTPDPIPILSRDYKQQPVLFWVRRISRDPQATPSSGTSAPLAQRTCSDSEPGSAQEQLGCVLSTPRATHGRLWNALPLGTAPERLSPPASAQSLLRSSQPPQGGCKERNLETLRTVRSPCITLSL